MEEKKKEYIIKEIKEIVITTIICFVFVFILVNYFYKPIRVVGSSMYPTLDEGYIGFTSIIGRNYGELNRFDIVVVNAKDGSNDLWVKRIIGLPNEKIKCVDGIIYINDKKIDEKFLDEDYVKSQKRLYGQFTEDFEEVKIPKDCYFIMGDNRHHSYDSREVGLFRKDDIIGKDTLVLYPFNKISYLD